MARSPRTGLIAISSRPNMARFGRRTLHALLISSVAASLGGCGLMDGLNQYFNLRNSFLDPSQVGRFDRDNPFGDVKPVTWPILEQLDVVDEPVDRWSNATDPTPADLVADHKEIVVGPGDLLRISVWELVQPGQEYLRDQAQVSESGGVTIQNLGVVQVAGLTPTQIEEKIGQLAVERNLLLPKGNGSQGPQVTVTLLQSRSRVFSILGSVTQAGTYNIIGNDFRVLDALALARDIAGGAQPGLDYLYVIRKQDSETAPAATPAENGPGAAAPEAPMENPLNALDTLEKPSTPPATAPAATTPTTGPGATGPRFVRPIATAEVTSSENPTLIAQADMDAAITPAPAAESQPAATTTSPVAATNPNEDLMNQAMGATTKPGNYVFIDGKWVALPATQPKAPASATAATAGPKPTRTAEAPTSPAAPAPLANVPLPPPTPPATAPSPTAFAAADQFIGQRVIRIPLEQLREGNPKYNIVIRPGDTIVVPTVEQGFFYIMGHVNKPGVYALSGQKITLKEAVAAAGNLDALAIPRRCDLIRRIGTKEEVTVQINLQAIFDGTQPDIFLKPNDLVNVGTDAVAPFLAVTRNGYRAAYGFGFTYDRNYYITPTIVQSGG